jgi:hypothetical protein
MTRFGTFTSFIILSVPMELIKIKVSVMSIHNLKSLTLQMESEILTALCTKNKEGNNDSFEFLHSALPL